MKIAGAATLLASKMVEGAGLLVQSKVYRAAGSPVVVAVTVICPSKFVSQDVLDSVLKLICGNLRSSRISLLIAEDSQPTPIPPAFRIAFTKYLSRAMAGYVMSVNSSSTG